LHAEDVDWEMKAIGFSRMKTGSVVQLHFGETLGNILNDLPGEGFLLPRIAPMKESDRAKAFMRRCDVDPLCWSGFLLRFDTIRIKLILAQGFTMKFSINTVLFVSPFTNEDTRLFAKFKKWGFDAVELLIEDPTHIDPALVKCDLDRNGLACGSVAASINPGRDLRGNAISQRHGVQYLCALIDQMVALDARVLGGPVYSYVGRAEAYSTAEKKRQWKTVVKNLKVVTQYAAAHGKLVCVEPLNRFETDFLNTIEQGLKLIADVGSPALKLHLDTFHANIEEKDQGVAIRYAGEHLGHIHACGCDRGTPGKDHIDWKSIAAALKAIKYDGDIALESVTLDVPRVASSAGIWRRMEKTRDEIAYDGLTFLRKTLA
jgi:D-psicose/D-tagatose/L-ribulose 3-epimerase